MKIKYGSTERTKILDDNGSTISTTTHYRAGIMNLPIRVRYKIKNKVKNQAEEHEAYMQFSNEHLDDKSMLDPSWEVERTQHGNQNGYYYVVKGYTRLEYDTNQ